MLLSVCHIYSYFAYPALFYEFTLAASFQLCSYPYFGM